MSILSRLFESKEARAQRLAKKEAAKAKRLAEETKRRVEEARRRADEQELLRVALATPVPPLLRDLASRYVQDATFSEVVIACWQSAGTKAETLAGGLATRLATGGFVGGPQWYEYGLVGLAGESLYLIPFGTVSGADVNSGTLNFEKTFAFRSRLEAPGTATPERHSVAAIDCVAKKGNADEYVNIKVTGDLRTEIMTLEAFAPGSVTTGVAIALAIMKEG